MINFINIIKHTFNILPLLFITSCGFQSIYSSTSQMLPIRLSSVEVKNHDPDKLDYEFKKILLDHISNSEFADHTLDIVLQKNQISFAYQSDTSNTALKIVLSANFTLKDKSGKILLQDEISVYSNANFTDSAYSVFTTNESTYTFLSKNIAKQISEKCTIYFLGNP